MRRKGTLVSPTYPPTILRSGNSPREEKTDELSNMQDNKSVYWYAFTTAKFASTSHAAIIKSKDRLREGTE